MIRALETIRHNKVTYNKGAIISDLTKVSEKRLVSLKSAEYVITPEEEMKIQVAKGESKTIDPQLFEELRSDLDAEYNADELKREAKEVGVDLTGARTKDEVIAAIINQGKADELLEDENNE